MKLMVLNFKFIVAVFVTMGYIICWRLLFSEKMLLGLLVASLAILGIVILYLEDIKKILASIKNMSRKKNNK